MKGDDGTVDSNEHGGQHLGSSDGLQQLVTAASPVNIKITILHS